MRQITVEFVHVTDIQVAGVVRKQCGISFEGAASPEKAVLGEVVVSEGLDDKVRRLNHPCYLRINSEYPFSTGICGSNTRTLAITISP